MTHPIATALRPRHRAAALLLAGLLWPVAGVWAQTAPSPATRAAGASQPATSSAPATVPEPAARRPNILVLMTDHQARGYTGFEGNTLARTPHLDRLAREGTVFTRCYVPTPQSGPSRAAMLTGLYPHSAGVTADGMPLSPYAGTFTARLKRAGYACGLVGTWELPAGDAARPGFGLGDYVATSDPPQTAADWLAATVHVNGATSKADRYLDDWHGDRALDALDKLRGGPFFLWVAFAGPDEPFVHPPGMEGSFPPASIELPRTRGINPQLWPLKLLRSPPAERFKGMNDEQLREARSKYLAMIARIDNNVGRILGRLDELELAEDTVVVFLSDSGFALGDHQLFGIGAAFYDEMVRVPLCVRWPASKTLPARIEHVVSLVDLCPTFCELAQTPVPTGLHGRSLAPLLKDPRDADVADERFFEFHQQRAGAAPGSPGAPQVTAAAVHAAPLPSTAPSGASISVAPSPPPGPPPPPPVEIRVRGVVTGRYKLIDYLDDQDRLYDLKLDPDEMQNVMSDFHYNPVQKVLYERLRQWRKQTRDPWPPQ